MAHDPLVGLWRGTFGPRTYGNGCLVAMTGTPAGYVMTLVEPYPNKRLSLRRVSVGTLVARLHWTGGAAYAGVHGHAWEKTWTSRSGRSCG